MKTNILPTSIFISLRFYVAGNRYQHFTEREIVTPAVELMTILGESIVNNKLR